VLTAGPMRDQRRNSMPVDSGRTPHLAGVRLTTRPERAHNNPCMERVLAGGGGQVPERARRLSVAEVACRVANDIAAETAVPSRNGSVTGGCQVCGGPLPIGRPRSTCSDACRQAKWRRVHQSPQLTAPVLPAARSHKAVTVYECADCGTRLLGTQFCDSCHTFMLRLGVGAVCPNCDEPITFDELRDA
jgi:hypothetical protein